MANQVALLLTVPGHYEPDYSRVMRDYTRLGPDVGDMPAEVIWHSNECHMHFLARHNHKINYISIFNTFLNQKF